MKPITYYVDPATPERYVDAVQRGIENWQAAFETAGFSNAIVVLEAPSKEEDPDWDPEDVRYSVARWSASEVRNAVGPSTSDPRTGEIIESDIVWFHNHMRSYRNWMMVQTGAANPDARQLPLTDELMEEAMEQVITHEIGHAIGLPHNMVASSSYPVDSLRSQSFASKMGVAPTIMDYARQNYIAQPEDGLEPKDFLRRIGVYDHHAVNWGYRVLPDADTPEDEIPTLNQWIVDRADDRMYKFLPGGLGVSDPRAQTEDMGDDLVRANTYGMDNLRRIVPNLVAWTTKPGEDYSDLAEIYGEAVSQWSRYVRHIVTLVGGVHADLKTADQEGPVFDGLPRAEQKRAMEWLAREAFTAPTWLNDPAIMERIGPSGASVANISRLQASVLNQLLSTTRMSALAELEVTPARRRLFPRRVPGRRAGRRLAGSRARLRDRTVPARAPAGLSGARGIPHDRGAADLPLRSGYAGRKHIGHPSAGAPAAAHPEGRGVAAGEPGRRRPRHGCPPCRHRREDRRHSGARFGVTWNAGWG